jgi:hypothetical protein
MVETQAQRARSLEELSLPEMVEGVPETVKTVFRPRGLEEVQYREMVETVLAPICCSEVEAEAAVLPRPVSREERAWELPGAVVAPIIQEEPEESSVVAEPVVLETPEESAASEQEAVVP